MTQTGDKTYGTEQEWELVIKRLGDIPRFLKVAQEQLESGFKAKNTADYRMLKRNGIDTAEADAKYFEETLPKLATERISGAKRDDLLKQLNEATKAAATSYRELKDYVAKTFFEDVKPTGDKGVKEAFRGDRFMMGEEG